MTLSKAEWRAVRPPKLQNLEAAKLMERLRRTPADRIEDWQDHLATADALQRVLARTPRMLGKAMPDAFRAALDAWQGDIDAVRKAGKRALDELAVAHVDDACSAIAAGIEAEGQALIARAEAEMRRLSRARGRDPRALAALLADLAALSDRIRLLRRNRMAPLLRQDRTAHDLIRAGHVTMRKFRMRCDPALKALQKALDDTRAAAAPQATDAPDAGAHAPRRRGRGKATAPDGDPA